MSRVISTVPEFLRVAAVDDLSLRRQLWVEQYERAFPELFESYYGEWGSPNRRTEAADRAPHWAQQVVEREHRLRRALERIGSRQEEYGFGEPTYDTVLLVGVGTSNGWATLLNGRPTLCLALETMNDEVGDEVVAVHEAMHAVQMGPLAPRQQWSGTFLHDFAAEGFAVAASRILQPGLTDSEYLWFATGYEDWITECERQEAQIRAAVGSFADAGEDDDDVQGLLTMNERSDGLPARCGYWLADQMVRDWMAAGASLFDIATMSGADASHDVVKWLQADG